MNDREERQIEDKRLMITVNDNSEERAMSDKYKDKIAREKKPIIRREDKVR